MEIQNLSVALGDSLEESVAGCISELAEVGLDQVMDEGLLKEVPFISTAVSLYKIGCSIRERNYIQKLARFLDEINKRAVSDEKRSAYQKKVKENTKFRNNEIEYILVLIDRYLSYNKPQMLAKLYLAYLDEEIIWEELTMYAEVIDRFILLDCETLVSDSERFIVHRNIGGEAILRLVALGLMTEVTTRSPFEEHGNGSVGMSWESLSSFQTKDRTYKRTEFGEKLACILKS